ncbi:MAG: Fpg/Nei family DNA glycosylase [Planctomycetaceae bacterium]
MPELPDITVYQEALDRFVVGNRIQRVIVRSPFVLRTFEPPVDVCEGREVQAIERLGKRLVFRLSDDLFVVVHLMIAGRFHWKKPGVLPTRKVDLAAFHFDQGTLMLTEASQKKRASIHVVQGREALAEHTRAGIDVLACKASDFADRLRSQNRTLKRALTDPSMFDGIGNAYSDEILHAARLSPVQLTSRLSDEEVETLFVAARETLLRWIDLLREEVGGQFPKKVTAFQPRMAVHGKFGQPCPICESKVQRIVYATREFNYCPKCQTKGKVLRDRSLSRLLKDDWPSTLE